MSTDQQNEPVFSEKEISVILKKATEIQKAKGGEYKRGLTQAELEAVAVEAGIDPGSVAAAVARMQMNKPELAENKNIFGGPLFLEQEFFVDEEVTEESWERIVNVIRKTFKKPARINEWGQSKEWTYSGVFERTSITVTPRNGRTKIHLSWRDPLRYCIYFNLVFSFLAFDIAAGAMSFAILLPLFATLFLLLRWITSKGMREERQKMKRLMSQIEQIIDEQTPVSERANIGTSTGHNLLNTSSPLLEKG